MQPKLFTTFLFYILLSAILFPGFSGEKETIDRHIKNKRLEIKRLVNSRVNAHQLIKEAKKKEWRILEVLKVLSENVEESKSRLKVIQEKIQAAELKILEQKNEIDRSQDVITRDSAKINAQLKNIQKFKVVRENSLFPDFQYFKNFQRNQELLKLMTRLDANLVLQLKKNLSLLESQQQVLVQHQTEMLELEVEEQEKADLVAFEERQQLAYLEHIRNDRNSRLEYLSEIEEEIEYLNSYIFSLQKQKKLAKSRKNFNGFRSQKGKLPLPVEGKLLSRFGESDLEEFVGHERGVLVQSPERVSVKAFLTGKVVFKGPFRGFHQLVILDHGKSCYSVYGYLNKVFVKQNDIIERGQIMGNVTWHPSHKMFLFYFETRYRGKAVDPLIWLKKPVWTQSDLLKNS